MIHKMGANDYFGKYLRLIPLVTLLLPPTLLLVPPGVPAVSSDRTHSHIYLILLKR